MTGENALLCFIEQARPLCEPAELLKLPPETRISFVNTIGGSNGNGRGRAGELLEEVRKRMARQARGFFTIEEAAQILADGVPGVEVKAMTRKLMHAFKMGRLTVRDPGDRAAVLDPHEVRAYYHLVRELDIDAWLLSEGVGYQFPKVGCEAAPVARESASETKEQRQDRRLKACVDAGLPMNAKTRLPDGVGKVADAEGVSRQAFSTDVKAALNRRENAKREGATVHRA